MHKKILFVVILTGISFSSIAHWDAGIKYLNIKNDGDGPKVSLNAVEGSIGFHYDLAPTFSLIPELRYAVGVNNDTVNLVETDIEFNLERYLAASIRAQYEFKNQFYVFVQPTYANIKTEGKVKNQNSTIEADSEDWNWGGGVGLGYRLSKSVSADFSYEWIDEADVITLGLRFDF